MKEIALEFDLNGEGKEGLERASKFKSLCGQTYAPLKQNFDTMLTNQFDKKLQFFVILY